jgi:Mce-associated membrane protein
MTLGVLCTAALITASALMVIEHRKAVDDRQLNAEYSAAGRQSVVTLMSLDFNNAEDDVKRIIDNTTGQFKTDFENQAADFVKVAKDSKVITDVTVTAVAVESMTPTSAVALVAATSRVTNASGAQQEPRAWRLSVNLERVDGGQIKMAKVEFVP